METEIKLKLENGKRLKRKIENEYKKMKNFTMKMLQL